jgi:[protein-PII] uridylyltransferase
MNDGYFLRHTPAEIAWHTRLLAEREPGDASPLVAVREATERGGNSVLTFMPHRQHNFARTTALLDQMGLNILDARITPLEGGLSLDTYLVLEDTGTPIADRHRAHEIEQQLTRVLALPEDATPPAVTRRAPRQVRMFSTPTQIAFTEDLLRGHTILELIAGDRPGLLSEVGKVLLAGRVDVVTARILTIGERAEDVFHVTDDRGQPLDEEARRRLQETLTGALDRRDAARSA